MAFVVKREYSKEQHGINLYDINLGCTAVLPLPLCVLCFYVHKMAHGFLAL